MMYRGIHKKLAVIFILIIAYIVFLFNNTNVFASQAPSMYVLVYDHLYEYAQNTSDVLRQYMELKSDGQDILLLQADKLDTEKIQEDAAVIIAASSFESEERLHQVLDDLNEFQVMIFDDEFISAGESLENPGLMVAVDRVYPFSDFNKLMDTAETMRDKGIDFIVTAMPVYENYELEAFDTYISVLRYVSKMGGHIFIHYPVENVDGTYNTDPRIGLEKAVSEYRKRGLDVVGIALPQDKLFSNTDIFEGLNLPFVLVTEGGRKVDSNADLYEISEMLNDYIVINGIDVNHFDFFCYRAGKNRSNQQSVYISAGDDEEKLYNLLKVLNAELIPVRDFKLGDYQEELKSFNYAQVNETAPSQEEKSELEMFKEQEMKKIRGENLEEERLIIGYDISWFAKAGIRVALIIFIVFIFQVLLGRHFDIKKFFKD